MQQIGNKRCYIWSFECRLKSLFPNNNGLWWRTKLNQNCNSMNLVKKSLKISIEKGQTTTMAKIKRTEEQTIIYKILHRKTKDRATQTQLNTRYDPRRPRRVRRSRFICGIHRATLATNQVVSKMLFTNIRTIIIL